MISLGVAVAALLTCVWPPQAAAAAGASRRPNIVLILADDLGYGNLGCYGTDRILTPNIDCLAAEGVRFTDAHAPAAVCQPTRYGILAGRDYYRSSWASIQSGSYFRDEEILLPQVFQKAGYRTAMFGKWHLGFGLTGKGEATDWNGELAPGPNEAGFDYWFGMPNAHNMPPFVFIENHWIYRRDPKDPLRMLSPEEAKAVKSATNWGASTGAKAAHDACDLERLDLIMAERAGDWISRQSSGQPFFLYLPLFAPHVPLLPAKEYQHTSPLGKSGPYTNSGRLGDVIQQQDHAVGMVMKTLKETASTTIPWSSTPVTTATSISATAAT
jgi:arylsulfatase A